MCDGNLVERHIKEIPVTFLKYAAAAVLLVPTSGLAQYNPDGTDTGDVDPTGAPVPPKDIIVTANGIAQPRAQVGQAITVIDSKTLEIGRASCRERVLMPV